MTNKKGVIIIPYRNREEHLIKFLKKFEELNLGLDIILVEQCDDELFNRGKLLNIGFEHNKDLYDYFIFHDVDMIPFKNIDYSYSSDVCHMANYIEQYEYRYSENYFGGVNLFPKDKFIEINGFSNNFWGWGREDDNLLKRCRNLNVTIAKRDGYYKCLSHEHNFILEIYEKNMKIDKEFDDNPNLIKTDGLSSLENYTLIDVKNFANYKHLKIKNI
jgi:predicted glycosyltransferase involved in capsule biosynthesis